MVAFPDGAHAAACGLRSASLVDGRFELARPVVPDRHVMVNAAGVASLRRLDVIARRMANVDPRDALCTGIARCVEKTVRT